MSVLQNQSTILFNKLIGLGVLLLGLAALLAAFSMLLYVAESAGEPLVEAPSPAKRGFQLVQLGEFRRDQFLLNTDSGRVWESVCSGDVKDGDCSGTMIWSEMCVEGNVTSKEGIAKCLGAGVKVF